MKPETQTLHTRFCVVGGGLAGLFAAVSAARHGVKTVLMQERPMLGGNASSEIRMWICGAFGHNNRETGLLEELALSHYRVNPSKLWPQWDGELYGLAKAEPNLTLLLNTSCLDAEMDGDRITAVTGWQMTTQRFIRVEADLFSDCSGDSILAPLTGAEFRFGREAASEFGEESSAVTEDRKTMGMSCLLQGRKLDHPVSYMAPSWATKLSHEDLMRRRPSIEEDSENYWYLELGGDRDSIQDTETVRDELVALAYGMWDALKNSGEFPETANWQLDFLGFLPGKRESRRMMGDYIMTQGDVADGGRFADTVAYGGWPLDDHEPRGFWYPGNPNLSVQSSSPYGIPYRCLYSRNIRNLFFAGRNISMTHAAMSSCRVMATCGLLGQAVGTAASVAVKYGTDPRGVYTGHLTELQQTLMDDGCFLPGFTRTVDPAVRSARLSGEKILAGVPDILRGGTDRTHPLYGPDDLAVTLAKGGVLTYTFDTPTFVSEVRLGFDSDLDRISLPGSEVERIHLMRANVRPDSPDSVVPAPLVRAYRLEAETESGPVVLKDEKENLMRTVHIQASQTVTKLTLTLSETWGADTVRLHAFDFKTEKGE